MHRRHLLFLLLIPGMVSAVPGPIEGITFAVDRGEVHVPAQEAAKRLGWSFRYQANRKRAKLGGSAFEAAELRQLPDGTWLVSLSQLKAAGATVSRQNSGALLVQNRRRLLPVSVGEKRVEVDLATQRLKAWQGARLLFESRISSGLRPGWTPTGSFTAGPYKARQHFSTKYDNSPMPWSVQVDGHIFIHGFFSVPDHPASHGCIRLPLDGGNPARFFFEWIDVGTPIQIRNGGP